MAIKKALLAACAALVLANAAQAAPPWVPPGNDPGGYYSNQDTNGFYDRDGRYQRIRGLGRDRDRMPTPNSYAPPGNDPGGYYSDADRAGYYDRDGRFRRVRFARGGGYGPPPPQPAYGPPPPPPPAYGPPAPVRDCRSQNRGTGTILGAIAGGLIGGFASHGNGLATVGGVIGGGVLGNVIGGDMDCEDQAQAYPVYVDSLNGDIGRPYEWHRGPNRGTFTTTREFRRGGQICREFNVTTWRGPNSHTRTGVACRELGDRAGWRFD